MANVTPPAESALIVAVSARELWKLVLSPKPKANAVLYATIPATQNHGVQIQKYSTRFGADFEKHTDADGIVTWWRLVQVSGPRAKRIV
jgi:hypothetical protein